MASVESPCFLLTREAPRSSVYACIPVDASLAGRSSVLATLMQSSGIQELPDAVTLDSFQTWCTMPLEDTDAVPVEDLASAVQVRCDSCSVVFFALFGMNWPTLWHVSGWRKAVRSRRASPGKAGRTACAPGRERILEYRL